MADTHPLGPIGIGRPLTLAADRLRRTRYSDELPAARNDRDHTPPTHWATVVVVAFIIAFSIVACLTRLNEPLLPWQ